MAASVGRKVSVIRWVATVRRVGSSRRMIGGWGLRELLRFLVPGGTSTSSAGQTRDRLMLHDGDLARRQSLHFGATWPSTRWAGFLHASTFSSRPFLASDVRQRSRSGALSPSRIESARMPSAQSARQPWPESSFSQLQGLGSSWKAMINDQPRTFGRGAVLLAEQLRGDGAPSPVTDSIAEAGAGQDRAAEVGTQQVGPAEVGTRQVRLAEVRLAEVGSGQESMGQASTPKVGPPEVGPAEKAAREVGAGQPGAAKVGAGQEGPAEHRSREIGVDQAHPAPGGPFQGSGVSRGLDGGELTSGPSVSDQVGGHADARCKSCVAMSRDRHGAARESPSAPGAGRPGRDVLARDRARSGRGVPAGLARPRSDHDAEGLYDPVGSRMAPSC